MIGPSPEPILMSFRRFGGLLASLCAKSSRARMRSASSAVLGISREKIAGQVWKNMMQEGNGARRIVGHWLVGTSGLVFGMVVLGGLTRLTESGLSMVDWSLVHFRAPSTPEAWQTYFEKYQQFPEYQLNNRGMTLDEFKRIYWMEHAHRVYGRLIGLFVILPATFFVAKKWVSPGMRRVLMGCCGLVGFQVRACVLRVFLTLGASGMVHGQEWTEGGDCAERRAGKSVALPARCASRIGICAVSCDAHGGNPCSF